MTEWEGRLLEALAEQEHARWSHWMAYMFHQGHINFGGEWVMPRRAVERWTRQMRTPYADLSEEERESDRKEARETLALLDRLTAAPDQEGA